MPNLPVPSFGSSLLPSRQDRQFSRALDQIESGAALEVAGVRAAEAVELAKIETLGAAGDTVLREVGRLARLQAFEAANTPHAEGVLQYVVIETAGEMVGRIRKLNRRLG